MGAIGCKISHSSRLIWSSQSRHVERSYYLSHISPAELNQFLLRGRLCHYYFLDLIHPVDPLLLATELTGASSAWGIRCQARPTHQEMPEKFREKMPEGHT